jgi:hypothetical protein
MIKSQTKAKKRSLEWEKSRSPKARATARHNRDKMLQNLSTPQGEAKGLDTIGKRVQLKSRRKRSPKCMNASSPWTNAFLQNFYPLMQKPPGNKNWVLSLPLVGNAWIKSTNASMCFSKRHRALQRAKKRHRQARLPQIWHKHCQRDR